MERTTRKSRELRVSKERNERVSLTIYLCEIHTMVYIIFCIMDNVCMFLCRVLFAKKKRKKKYKKKRVRNKLRPTLNFLQLLCSAQNHISFFRYFFNKTTPV